MNPYDSVSEFESLISKYCGSYYAIAVESCSAAIFLCCEMLEVKKVYIPKHTYPSVANAIIHAGGEIVFTDENWKSEYELAPYKIYDSALRFKRNMYHGGFQCLSFHSKKHLPIGRGGMILTNDPMAAKYLHLARFDGRDQVPLKDQKDIKVCGWNMYMTPEQAVRGIELFNVIKDKELEDLSTEGQDYPDLSKFSIYK